MYLVNKCVVFFLFFFCNLQVVCMKRHLDSFMMIPVLFQRNLTVCMPHFLFSCEGGWKGKGRMSLFCCWLKKVSNIPVLRFLNTPFAVCPTKADLCLLKPVFLLLFYFIRCDWDCVQNYDRGACFLLSWEAIGGFSWHWWSYTACY